MASCAGRQAFLVVWAVLSGREGAAISSTTPTAATTTLAPAAALGTNCLVNATYQPHERTDVTFNGIQMPLMISHFSWDSSKVLATMYRIIVREVLGVNAEFARSFSTSKKGFRAIAGCQNPEAASEEEALCGVPGPQREHVVVECWDSYASSAMNYILQKHPDSYPVKQGECGFQGRDGMFVTSRSLDPAFEQYHLPLEYYYSYSNPHIDVSGFFTSPWDIDTRWLRFCNETGLNGFAKDYYALSQDDEGIIVSRDSQGDLSYKVNCTSPWPHWWLSPACRRNTSRCIPWVSADYGWYADAMMHRAFAWDVPVAIATGKTYSDYTMVPQLYATMLYWWFPDTAFISTRPKEILWPPYDAGEWSRNIFRTDTAPGPTHKWSYGGLSNRSNVGFAQPLALLKNMMLGYQAMYDILEMLVARSINTDEQREQFVCEWLNNNTDTWMRWRPEETACIEGMGLVDMNRVFVPTRAEADKCAWCTPGKISERLSDAVGNTFKCVTCPSGMYQENLGATECHTCTIGMVPSLNQDTCAFCAVGKYSTSRGAASCTDCPPTFTTSNPGSTDPSQCICKEHYFLSLNNTKRCLPCPTGMICGQGSDARGFTDPAYPVTPLLAAGYWSSLSDPVNVFRCESIERCPGNRRPGNACNPHLEFQACAVCEDGWVWGGDRCNKCAGFATSFIIFPLSPIVAGVTLILILYKMGGDSYERWGSWQNGLSSMLFILLNHYQVVSILSGVDVMFPAYVTNLLRAFTFTNDIMSVFSPTCIGIRSKSATFTLRCILPILLLALYAITFGISRALGRKFPSVAMEFNRTLNGYFSLILTFFIALSEVCFEILKCVPNPNGTASLLSDRSITCFDTEWNTLVVLGAAALIIWVGGFGIIFLRAIIAVTKNFHDTGVQMRWKFLFIRYRPDVHWWGVTLVVRGILLNAGFTFIIGGVGQILWLISLLAVYSGVMFIWRPWRHMLNNFLDLTAHLNLMLIGMAATWFANVPGPNQAERTDTVSFYFLCVALCVFIPFVPTVFLMYWAQNSPSAVMMKHTELHLILDSFEQVGRAGEQTRRDFLMGLDEIDFWFMMVAKDILQTEFAKRRCRAGYSTHKLSKVPLHSIRELRTNSERNNMASRITSAIDKAPASEMQLITV